MGKPPYFKSVVDDVALYPMVKYKSDILPPTLAEQLVMLTCPNEINKWCDLLECNEKYLRYAVLSIGNKASKVNDFLILNRLKNETV